MIETSGRIIFMVDALTTFFWTNTNEWDVIIIIIIRDSDVISKNLIQWYAFSQISFPHFGVCVWTVVSANSNFPGVSLSCEVSWKKLLSHTTGENDNIMMNIWEWQDFSFEFMSREECIINFLFSCWRGLVHVLEHVKITKQIEDPLGEGPGQNCSINGHDDWRFLY